MDDADCQLGQDSQSACHSLCRTLSLLNKPAVADLFRWEGCLLFIFRFLKAFSLYTLDLTDPALR